LSAALLLGRCRRRVLVCDTREPRNRWARAVNGFFSRDGVPPHELLELAREQLGRYDTVELREACVEDAERVDDGFEVMLAGGGRERSRTLLLATGVVDDVPDIPGFADLYGEGVHHCPYCDGWEYSGRRLAAYGRGDAAFGLAQGLTVWTDDVVLCTDGPSGLDDERRAELAASGIDVREEPVTGLESRGGTLTAVLLDGGGRVECDGLFFATGQRQASRLPAKFGCHFTSKGAVATGTRETTDVPGLFVAGDASKNSQLVAIAVGEGTEAGFEINRTLLEADLAARREAARRGTPARPASAAEPRS
ncbi:MAG: NAD(P)/FAD-dependent oxidoreductase, partial [Gemmatimonadota bacterium]|nr:NAD(P)/FAD-dependent oxidoreductase [Gemmatimonadota bacterium]